MLVLSATYQSHLRNYISKEDLLPLLNRTIHFLNSLAPLSTTLAQDVRILIDVKEGITEVQEPVPTYDLPLGHVGMSPGMGMGMRMGMGTGMGMELDLTMSGHPGGMGIGMGMPGGQPATTSSFSSSHSGVGG